MNRVNGAMILDEIVERLNIDLPGLVAGCAFWSPANTDATKAAYPSIRRARSGEEPVRNFVCEAEHVSQKEHVCQARRARRNWQRRCPASRKNSLTMTRFVTTALLAMSLYGCGTNEITVYPISCDKKCYALNRSVFRVDADRHTVVSWAPGVVDIPNRLEGCVVRDSENWKCKEGRDGHITMLNGNLSFDPPLGGDLEYVGAVRWWLAYLGISNRKFPKF